MRGKAAAVLILLFAVGCAQRRVSVEPFDPAIIEAKNIFEERYGFFITSKERNEGYSVEDFSSLDKSITAFDRISNISEFHRFEEHFWKIRDTNPNTPENEFKDKKDGLIADIENEIFAMDLDTPGLRFDANGGLKGDLARVYLLWGPPHYKERLAESGLVDRAEMMVWYYFDDFGGQPQVRFRFLFYVSYGKMVLFKEYFPVIRLEDLVQPLGSPLRKLSTRPFPNSSELEELWYSLLRDDPRGIFISALFEFSPYEEWLLERGNGKDKFGALDPPEPVLLTAERMKTNFLGQPNIPEGTELFTSSYFSFIPAYLRANVAADNDTFLMLTILHRNLDWEKRDDKYITRLHLRISFQHKESLKLTEFFTAFKKEIGEAEFNRRDEIGVMVVFPSVLRHWGGDDFTMTLGEMLNGLEEGDYIVNLYLQHPLTKKYNAWRTETRIVH